MKNYFFGEAKSREFIEDYEVSGSKILLFLGTGEKHVIDNSPENLKKVESTMRSQIENGKKQVVKLNLKRMFSCLMESLTVAGIVAIAVAAGIGMLPITSVDILIEVLTSLMLGLGCFVAHKKQKEYVEILRDIEKNNIFVEIEDRLNHNLQAKNKNTFSRINAQTMQTLYSKETIDLPTLDGLTLEELRTMKANIERQENFGFVENGEQMGCSMQMKPKKSNGLQK